MASIIKMGNKWRVTVCVNGKRKTATRYTKREAQVWADDMALRLRQEHGGSVPDRPFSDLMERYSREVSPTKRGWRREQQMIAVILRDEISRVPLPDLASRHIAGWKERRLRQVSGATVDREMTILTHACSIARKEWGWLRVNPVSDVSRPPPTQARKRRPTDAETGALIYTLGYQAKHTPKTAMARVGAAYLFAIETAMRAREICELTWGHVHDGHVHLPQTKNGHARDVPLSKEAKRIIKQLQGADENSVFALSTASLDALFRKAKKRAMIEDLHFHDTRREALTRLAKIFGVMELARISGHRDLRILQNVYYAPSVEELAGKLA